MKLRATPLVIAFVVVSVGLGAPAATATDDDALAGDIAAATAPCFGEPLCVGAGALALWPVLSYTALIVDLTSLWSLDNAGPSGTGNRVLALVHVER